MTIIKMESGGPWYTPNVMVHAILGRRAMLGKKFDYRTVIAQIESNLRPSLQSTGKEFAPTLQTARSREQKNPVYPEWLIRNGLVKEADLLPWARDELRSTKERNRRGNQAGSKVKYNPNAALFRNDFGLPH